MSGTAPFHAALADGPPGAQCYWLRTADSVRLRVAHWPADAARAGKGTVYIFPGRTEFVEKYGRTAAALAARGYDSVALDWRGQGLSDRPLSDPMVGHVRHFSEYQLDVQALVQMTDDLDLPRPRFLLTHSMGGCIGLRALAQGLPVQAAAFSAPMWGIKIAPSLRPLAIALAGMSKMTRQDHRYAPGTNATTYVAVAPYQDNLLTTDPEMFAWMKAQVTAEPALALGGPSLGWLHAALTECRRLAAQPSPGVPALCALGTAERVVDTQAIKRRMARWPTGRLELFEGAEHEVIMETRPHRERFHDAACDLFEAQR